MKPTYEELEATNEVLRKALEDIEVKTCADFIGEDEIKDYLNELWLIARNAMPEKAGYVVLTRLETLEKALKLSAALFSSSCAMCPIEEKCPLEEIEAPHDDEMCRNAVKEWLIKKAGE